MSNEGKNIKTYQKELSIFFILNLILYSFFIFGTKFSLDFLNKLYTLNLIEKGTVLIFALSFIVLVLNYVITSNFKAELVFWKRKDVYPGYRIFTELESFKDNRINESVLIKKHGNLPNVPEKQNNLWYKIFKKYEFKPMIFESHRKFLMFRDLTGLSFIILIAFFIVTPIFLLLNIVAFKWTPLKYFYIPFLIGQYIILACIARDRGNRFVCNVLAEESNVSDE